MQRLSAVSNVISFRSYICARISAGVGTLAALVFAATAQAGVQPLPAIQAAAEQFVRSSLPENSAKHFVTAGNLDPRLRLDECSSPLEAFSQGTGLNSGRMTVGVRCPAGNPWTIYVQVGVEVEVSVLVLRRPLARRARVELADVEPQVRRLAGSAAVFINDTATLQGHRLKRSLPVGTALTVEMLQPDVLVRRGQQVTLIANSGSVQIRAQGQALTEGGAYDRVRVQNVSSLKVVEGVVESDGVVRVGS
ncbi:flagellar basal body P-ring formation chaperone FlgA [Steroidobacter sp.]|uniref:flagellar basal body P-ring formation chaperone FlgA n=1 Tax=Steroidobacter sp. TaxID=1978227 RepID=UPI001A5D2765|nr:flagellar basal body P-ring formation chaperone FlgA [Steroidobacter sp.]MBL8266913.1 flagellar basal body P-ring formation protein FlgA [Steroidobacter sp.]